MRSSPQTTVLTVPTAGSWRYWPPAAGAAARSPVHQRSGDRPAGSHTWATIYLLAKRWSAGRALDAICEPALIGDGSRLWAIKKDPLVGHRRGRGGMTSLGVDDAERGT